MHLLNYMYKGAGKPEYLSTRACSTRQYDAPVLKEVASRSKEGDRSVFQKGAKAWNILPAEVRKLPSYKSFKRHQKNWLLSTVPGYQ